MAKGQSGRTLQYRIDSSEDENGNTTMGISSLPTSQESVSNIRSQILKAFDTICDSNPGLVNSFQEAFEYRRRFSELPESRTNGMLPVISSVLWRSLPERYFRPRKFAITGELDSWFVGRLKAAIAKVAEVNPDILADLKEYCDQTAESYQTILMGQLALYIDNKRAFPF